MTVKPGSQSKSFVLSPRTQQDRGLLSSAADKYQTSLISKIVVSDKNLWSLFPAHKRFSSPATEICCVRQVFNVLKWLRFEITHRT